jgi:hypothetical protein
MPARNRWRTVVTAAVLASAGLAAPELAAAPVKKVLILGIDGCRPDALRKANTPNLDALVADGYSTFNARTCRHSHSGPAWSSILAGIWEEKHLILDNTFRPKDLIRYPPLFVRLKEKMPAARSAIIVDWPPLREHLSAGTYRADLITTPNSRDFPAQDAMVTARAVQFLGTEDPDVLFVYWVNVDETGHASGFSPDNANYIAAIENVDGQVGMVLGALRRRPTFADEDWLIITTTDHGGTERAHGRDIPEHTTIFLFVSGPSARKGTATESAAAVDVAATALAHMLGGPSAVAPSWGLDGRVFGLAAAVVPTADGAAADARGTPDPDGGAAPEEGSNGAAVDARAGGADRAAPTTPGDAAPGTTPGKDAASAAADAPVPPTGSDPTPPGPVAPPRSKPPRSGGCSLAYGGGPAAPGLAVAAWMTVLRRRRGPRGRR